MICLYHNDLDGICSAAIVMQAHPKVSQFHAIDYGDNIPWDIIKNDDVVLVDFSFSPGGMQALIDVARKIVWIDHHKTAIDRLDAFAWLPGIRDVKESGCMLTWKYFMDGIQPRSVLLSDDWDLHTFHFEKTRPFHAGIMLREEGRDPNSDIWYGLLKSDTLADKYINDIVEDGRVVLKSQANDDRDIVARLSFIGSLAGYQNVMFVNARLHDSQAILLAPSSHPIDFLVMYWFNGRNWRYELRSLEIDVGIIANQFSGGGHTHAAGFLSHAYLPRMRPDVCGCFTDQS